MANLFRLCSVSLSGICVTRAFFFFGLIEVACLTNLFQEFKDTSTAIFELLSLEEILMKRVFFH